MAVVAIDAGTTMIKAVVFDADGHETAVARQGTRVARPRPAFAEQDMIEVWDAVVSCVRATLAETTEAVDAVTLTAQGDGCWLVDGAGRPTGPAVLWNDGRAADIVADWRSSGVLDEAFRRTGCAGFAGLPNAILAWLNANDPGRIHRSAAALTCGGWLFAQLTGEIAVDESDAAAPWLDVAQREYAEDLLGLYDLAWAGRLLPTLRHADQRLGPLRPEAAAVLGLPAGTAVVLSPYDIAATAIGVGAIDEGQVCGILGTTLCTEAVTTRPDPDAEPVGLTIPLGSDDWYLRAFPTLSGCEVLDWAAELLGLADAEEVPQLAQAASVGSSGLTFLPYLSPAGERAPFLDPAARGSFTGLSLDHDRASVARAVLEGLSYVIRDCLEDVPVRPTELRLCGGGANSAQWCQLIADVTGVPVLRSADREAGAKGAFVTALVATGQEGGYATAARRSVRVQDTFRPDADRSPAYDELFPDFRVARAHAAGDWPRLREVRAKLHGREDG